MLVRYDYANAAPTRSHLYLWPLIKGVIEARPWPSRRAFDLGCGNGATCRALMDEGFEAVGIDPSESGVANARRNGVRADVASAYDDLSGYGAFPLVISLEVIAHCLDPRAFARTFLSLIAPGGVGLLSAPYHGYLKNVALALTGKMDDHFNPLWEGAQIKFFSIASLTRLLVEEGAGAVRFARVGRIPPLAKSMVAIVEKPRELTSLA